MLIIGLSWLFDVFINMVIIHASVEIVKQYWLWLFWNLRRSPCTATAKGNINNPLLTRKAKKAKTKQHRLHPAAQLITLLWLRLLSVHTFFFLSGPGVDLYCAQHFHSVVRYSASVARLSAVGVSVPLNIKWREIWEGVTGGNERRLATCCV